MQDAVNLCFEYYVSEDERSIEADFNNPSYIGDNIFYITHSDKRHNKITQYVLSKGTGYSLYRNEEYFSFCNFYHLDTLTIEVWKNDVLIGGGLFQIDTQGDYPEVSVLKIICASNLDVEEEGPAAREHMREVYEDMR